MKLKDLYTNLEKEINLLKFKPKKEISVDSFWVDKKIVLDISKNKFKKIIKFKKESKLKIKKINKKNKFDALNFTKRKLNINLIEKENKINIKTFTDKNKTKKIFSPSILTSFKDNYNLVIGNFFNKIPKIIIYFLIFILVVFIDKLAVEYFTNSWYKKLIILKNSTEEINKNDLIQSSNLDFKIANILFLPFKIFPWNKINNASNAILWGVQTTNFLLNISDFIEKINNFIKKKWEENIAYSQLLDNSKDIFIYSENEINNILETYNKIKFSDNILLKNKLDYFKFELKKIWFYINTINNNFNTFLNILWHNKRKKYLILFQNNDEIRSQWGFMWSMWILEIFRWQIKKIEKKDVYDYEFKIKKEHFTRENAPEGLKK